MKRPLCALAIVVTLLASCSEESPGGGSSEPAGDGGDLVTGYCSYGSVSQAQLEGCIEHVTPRTVDSYSTNSARYARGTLDSCLADAGPFCEPR